jgi:hypothetical protein
MQRQPGHQHPPSCSWHCRSFSSVLSSSSGRLAPDACGPTSSDRLPTASFLCLLPASFGCLPAASVGFLLQGGARERAWVGGEGGDGSNGQGSDRRVRPGTCCCRAARQGWAVAAVGTQGYMVIITASICCFIRARIFSPVDVLPYTSQHFVPSQAPQTLPQPTRRQLQQQTPHDEQPPCRLCAGTVGGKGSGTVSGLLPACHEAAAMVAQGLWGLAAEQGRLCRASWRTFGAIQGRHHRRQPITLQSAQRGLHTVATIRQAPTPGQAALKED